MLDKNNQTLDQYAVIGNPIAHSQSPRIHAAFAKQCQQVMHYSSLLAPLDGFVATVRQFIDEGGRGANVTLPFKLEAFDLCDEVTPRALAAGAVNTLRFENNYIFGDNTDGAGLVTDITLNANWSLKDKRILLLGAGGAAHGVLLPLLECEPSKLVIANRSAEKAQQLAEKFKQVQALSYAKFDEINGQFDVIINATSASIDAQLPPIPNSVFGPHTLAYDMMYGEQSTLFMQHAARYQAQTRDGWGMLVEQAAEAFCVWRGIRPNTSELLVSR